MEKFLIVADIHGSMIGLDKTLMLFEELNADKLIILGDTFGVDVDKMVEKLNVLGDKLEIIKGNNDWYYEPQNARFQFRESTFVNLNGTLAFACHGHRLDDMNLAKYGAKIIMQGHVHNPFIENRRGIIRFCPGSIASPRFGAPKSFAFVSGRKISLCSLEMDVLDEIEF